jgi:hypothetical protein
MDHLHHDETHRDIVLDLLKTGVCRVRFKKVNGELRDLQGTLNFDLISTEERPESPLRREKMQNPDVQSVFDLDKAEWRSFRWENLLSVEPVEVAT